jgi:hypothetical protein
VPRMRAWISGTATTSTTRPMMMMSFLFMASFIGTARTAR